MVRALIPEAQFGMQMQHQFQLPLRLLLALALAAGRTVTASVSRSRSRMPLQQLALVSQVHPQRQEKKLQKAPREEAAEGRQQKQGATYARALLLKSLQKTCHKAQPKCPK